MTKKAKIQQGGLFRKGRVIITNVLKNGEDGESKVYTTAGKVKISKMDGKYILDFSSVSGGSVGMTSRGTVSGRSYVRKQSIIVDSYIVLEDDRGEYNPMQMSYTAYYLWVISIILFSSYVWLMTRQIESVIGGDAVLTLITYLTYRYCRRKKERSYGL